MIYFLPLFPLLGGLLALFSGQFKTANIKLFVAFSGAFLFSITILNIFPEIFEQDHGSLGIFILFGFLFQLVIEQFTKGLEHGHLHLHKEKNFMLAPLFISLSLHSFLEGYPLGGNFFEPETKTGFIVGIGLHEIPAAFALVTIIRENGSGKGKSLGFLLVYSCMCLLGVAFSSLLGDSGFDWVQLPALAFVAGIFLHISTTILFENSENHLYNRLKLLSIIIGMSLAAGIAYF